MPAATGAELLDRPLWCCVITSLPASIGEGRAPRELQLGAAIAGAAPPLPAISGAGLLGAFLGAFLFKNAFLHHLPQLLP